MIPNLAELRFSDVADVLIVAVLLWLLIVWIRTTRARLAFVGLGILGALYLLAQQLELQLTTWLFQGFFAAVVLVMIVVFQDDLRRLFERIAVTGLRRRRPRSAPRLVDTLVRTCNRLAQSRYGALIVIPGRDPLERHLEGGLLLRGRVSEPLLLSIFDPHSPGHDGAIVLDGDQVVRFGVHLPLSLDSDAVGAGGTRHLAALGLAERSDALVIVISEERGTISVARHGEIRVVDADGLARELRSGGRQPSVSSRAGGRLAPLARALAGGWREGLLALVFAVGLWLVLVPGDTVVEVDLDVPVKVENLPQGYALEEVNPPSVSVRISGRRRDLVLTDRRDLRVRLDALLVQLGRRTFEIGTDQVVHPPELQVVSITPAEVKLSVKQAGAGSGG